LGNLKAAKVYFKKCGEEGTAMMEKIKASKEKPKFALRNTQ
jgi:hypothetical protein